MLSARRVFITGSGVVSGRAASVADLWSQVHRGERIEGSVAADEEIASSIGLAPGDLSILGRHQLLVLGVAEQAWRSAGLGSERNRLRGEGSRERRSAFGCVGGSSLGGIVAMERDLASSRGGRFSPYAVSRWRGNSVPAVVSLRHGLGGTVLSLNEDSATGAQILWMAGSLIRSGIVDAAVCVASDSALSDSVAKAMARNGSVARKPDSSPLSGNRSGMTPAEGSAALILESEAHAVTRGGALLAEWLGGASANESYHLQAPDPSGATLERLIRDVIKEVPDASADWVSLHATGTSRYDAIEVPVLIRIFGDRLPWISAFKRITGHALSASGLMEAALLVEGFRTKRFSPPLSGVDEALCMPTPLGVVASGPRTALQIGQGMGGDVIVNLLGAI